MGVDEKGKMDRKEKGKQTAADGEQTMRWGLLSSNLILCPINGCIPTWTRGRRFKQALALEESTV